MLWFSIVERKKESLKRLRFTGAVPSVVARTGVIKLLHGPFHWQRFCLSSSVFARGGMQCLESCILGIVSIYRILPFARSRTWIGVPSSPDVAGYRIVICSCRIEWCVGTQFLGP